YAFSPAELYLLFQQNGLLESTGKGSAFVKALATGRFPKEELEKFVSCKPSLVDNLVQDRTQTLEAVQAKKGKSRDGDDLPDRADELVEEVKIDAESLVPVVETRDVLDSFGLQVIRSADEEAVEFLIASAVAKLWKHAYQDEAAAVAQAEAFHGEGYAEQVRNRFLQEYRQANELPIPEGYAFRNNPELALA